MQTTHIRRSTRSLTQLKSSNHTHTTQEISTELLNLQQLKEKSKKYDFSLRNIHRLIGQNITLSDRRKIAVIECIAIYSKKYLSSTISRNIYELIENETIEHILNTYELNFYDIKQLAIYLRLPVLWFGILYVSYKYNQDIGHLAGCKYLLEHLRNYTLYQCKRLVNQVIYESYTYCHTLTIEKVTRHTIAAFLNILNFWRSQGKSLSTEDIQLRDWYSVIINYMNDDIITVADFFANLQKYSEIETESESEKISVDGDDFPDTEINSQISNMYIMIDVSNLIVKESEEEIAADVGQKRKRLNSIEIFEEIVKDGRYS